MKSIEFKIFEIMKTILYPISLILLFITLLSCKTEQPKYIEIKEPENTKKIIETRCYEIAGEIDGDYIPGEEYIGIQFRPTKNYYGADDKILSSIEDYGYGDGDYAQKHLMIFTNYKYDSKHQLDNITEVWVRGDVGWTGIVELIDTSANLTFKRNELGLVTEIEGFGSVITPDDEVYETTKFIYNKDGKIVREVHDSYYKTYQYFSLRNGHTVVKCDEYGKDFAIPDFPVYQGKMRSLTEIYDNGQKVKSLEQEYIYGKLYSDNETTFMYDDKNRMIQYIKKRAEADGMNVINNGETYEDYMNRMVPMVAMDNEIKEYKYDKMGNLIDYKVEYLKPKLDGGRLRIGDKLYSYTKKSESGNIIEIEMSESGNRGLKYYYYYNEYGDWYKCYDNESDFFGKRRIIIRNIEYRR